MIVGSLLLLLVSAGLLGGGLVADSNALFAGSIGTSLLAGVVLYAGARQSTVALGERRAGVPARSRAGTRRRHGSSAERQSRSGAAQTAVIPAVEVDANEVDTEDRRSAGQRAAPPPYSESSSTHPGRPQDREGAPQHHASAPAGYPSDARKYEGSIYRSGNAGAIYYAQSEQDVDAPTADTVEHRAERPLEEESAPNTTRYEAAVADSAVDDAQDLGEDEDPPDEPKAQPTPPAVQARVAQLTTDVIVVDGRPRYHLANCVHLIGREAEPLPVNEAIELGFTPCSLCDPDTTLLAE